MAVAVSISPRKRAESQPARLRTIDQRPTARYGASSASMPPSFWMSSVASCSATSSMSSTVTMPSMWPSASVVGGAHGYERRVFDVGDLRLRIGHHDRFEAKVIDELSVRVDDVDDVERL